MKVPVSWLREYVDFDASAEVLAEKLTFSGIEVEGIATIGSDCAGLVVVEVVDFEPHPGAEQLRLCRVSNGRQELPIVCGADNFEPGDKVPLAGIGTTLPNGTVIEEAEIRGHVSQGMLCAEDELGISDDHSGVLLLPKETPAGTPLVDVLGAAETVLEVEVTWNRSDCLSIIGIAREVAALFGSTLKRPGVEFPESGGAVEDLANVKIEDPAGCPRYTARVLSGISIGPSPMWMQQRLRLSGVRPIGSIVDAANYVMLECGHPLHAFDYDLLEDGRIIVRRARPGEQISTLDEIERVITPDMLVIADAARPVALAGVMGGAGSEISGDTHNVLLESAAFAPPLIHSTSLALGCSTESSHRFERGVDADGVEWASRRAAQLMVELAGVTAARGVIDCYPGRQEQVTVSCRYQKARDLIGIEIADEEITGILERLEIPVVERDAKACTVRIPTFRPDLRIEADLIEEVARIHGLDNVPAASPRSRIVPGADDSRTRAVLSCRAALVGLGLSECMHYSFASQQLLDQFDRGDGSARVVLPNPVSAEYGVLRDSLLPQMMETLGRNLAHQIRAAGLFEIGRVFARESDGSIKEEERAAIGLMGNVGRVGPDGNRPVEQDEIFLWMKGIMEQFLLSQHVAGAKFEAISHPCFEEGWCTALCLGDRELGVMGVPRKSIRSRWRMAEPVAVGEFELEPLCATVFGDRELEPVPVYPGVRRDMAIIVQEQVTSQEILNVVQKNAPQELTSVTLFDIFRGEGVGQGFKSLAYSLMYRSLERSLTDEDANQYHESIKAALKSALNVEVRDG